MKYLSTPLLAAALLLVSAHGQAQAPLSLDAAIALALKAHPSLRAAAHDVAAQEGALAQAGALPNPELELLREGERADTRTTTAQLAIPFELGGKRAARIDAARQDGRLAALELAALRTQLRADTAAAFHEVVAATERRRMAQELAELAASAADATQRRVEAGKSSPVDATRARVAHAGARIDLVQAERELESARIRLAALWGGDPRTLEVQVPATLELPRAVPLEQLLARLEEAPDLQRARLRIGQREALARVEQSRRMPDVNLIVGTRREGRDERNQAVVGVSLPLPLFNRNQGAVREALRRVDQARDEREAEQLRVRAELSQAHARLSAALEEATLIASDILPGAEQAYRAARRGFEAGKFGFLDVLDAQRTLFQSKNQYLNAVAESRRAQADIARITGAAQENP
jgi:cobalt-zinc-cadmium efflux system outer membrane protein